MVHSRFSNLVMILSLTLSVEAFCQNRATGFLDRTIRLGDKEYRYQVYIPAEFNSDRKWPVILFLHGAGERGSDGLKQTQVGLGTAIRMNPDWFPAVVLFPQLPLETVWIGNNARMASKVLDQAITEFHGDPGRIYLTGLSLGGYGTWLLAFEKPERFAAIVPICGGIVSPPGRPVIRQLPATVGAKDPYALVASRLKSIPTWVFHGATDDVIPATESRKMVEALKKVGAEVRYTEYKGVGHVSWDQAYADPALWKWLFSQRRNF